MALDTKPTLVTYSPAELVAYKEQLRQRIDTSSQQITMHWKEALNPFSASNMSNIFAAGINYGLSSRFSLIDSTLLIARLFRFVKKLIRGKR